MDTPTTEGPPPGVTSSAPVLTAALLASLLAACGGGADVPQALMDAQAAPYRPDLLPHDRAADLAPHHRNALAQTAEGRRFAQAARTPTADEFFEWAEKTFPVFFPGPAETTFANNLLVRFYAGTQIYLSVSNDARLAISGLGPVTGGKAVSLGLVGDYADAILLPTPAATPLTDEDAARFLLHAAFAATPEDIAAVRAKGYAKWLDEQLAMPSSQTAWDWLVGKGYSRIDTNEYFFASGVFRYSIWYQLFQSPDAVRRRFALALSEVFVVAWDGIKDVMNWDSFGMAAYWDILCKHAFGNYRDLIEELTLNPAMGAFLNTRGNQKEDPATGRLPDENYARELMQLFSIGLYELNLDGTNKLGAGGLPVETYTQADVSNLARVFTGYNHDYSVGTFNSPKPPNPKVQNLPIARGNMPFNAGQHSTLEKKFLGVTIPAGTSGPESLRIALDTIFNHPNVGPFLARQFIQRLVTSNPSAGYVARVASVFNNNGAGVRGDLKATLRAILLDPEARGAASLANPLFGKLREPMLRVAQWGRTFKARSVRGSWKLGPTPWTPREDIAQYPLEPNGVFNFFRPGYVPAGTVFAQRKATMPEFQIINESTVSTWPNFLQGWVGNGFWVRAPELPNNPPNETPTDGPDIVPDYSTEIGLFGNPRALVQRLNLLLCAGQLSQATQDAIVNALLTDRPNDGWNADGRKWHTVRGIFMVMCCAEYLAQR